MQWVWNNQKAIRAEKHKGLHGVVMEGNSVNEGVGTHGGSFEEAHFRQSTKPTFIPLNGRSEILLTVTSC